MIIKYSEFIFETTKYKTKNDTNFMKLVSRVLEKFKEVNIDIISDFKKKLFEYLSSDESSKFKINLFAKEYIKLIDLVHALDAVNAKIMLQRNKKNIINVDLPNLTPVWKDDESKIYVYHARNVFDAIALGKGTNFCISSDYKNGENYFYNYIYDYDYDHDKYKQYSTIYFIKSINQSPEYQTLALDYRHENKSFLYTDVRNDDKEFKSYKKMISDPYVSQDLKKIPEEIFKFVNHNITEYELKNFSSLIEAIDGNELDLYKIENDVVKYLKKIDMESKNDKYDIPYFFSKSLVNGEWVVKECFGEIFSLKRATNSDGSSRCDSYNFHKEYKDLLEYFVYDFISKFRSGLRKSSEFIEIQDKLEKENFRSLLKKVR